MSKNHSGRAFYVGLLEALTQVMGSAKGYLVDHGPRVALLSSQLGKTMGLTQEETAWLHFASILSDMGMVGLAEEAWEAPKPTLPDKTLLRVRQHPVRSEQRVAGIPHLEKLAPLVRHHHEWWNGSGYPDGLSARDIPVAAQVLRLADTVTALGQPRPHRGALNADEILEVVQSGVGVEFGPEVVRTYVSLHCSDDIPEFDAQTFRHATTRAAEYLLPDRVSPLSSEQLLAILGDLIDAKDPYTAGHSRRVGTLAVGVARQMGLEAHLRSTLWAGGYLHDLGKLTVPLRILAKTGRLTWAELEEVRNHPTAGAEILETIPSLRHLTTGARYHHERWDGSGYPEGLSGNRIPLVGQILAVCDSYDAMTSSRAYREGYDHAVAMEEVARCSGTQFSPKAAAAFLALPDEFFAALDDDESERPASEQSMRPRRWLATAEEQPRQAQAM